MKGILRANLSESKSNYIATIVAIMLAVTFLQVCLGLTAATNLSMRNNLAREIYGANLVASAPFAEAHPLAGGATPAAPDPAVPDQPGWHPQPGWQTDTSAHSNPEVVASLNNVTKVFGTQLNQVHALRGINLQIYSHQFTAIMGPSGSGKSTLLHVLAGLDSVSSGTIICGGTEITKLPDRALTKWRRNGVGFIFQSFNLIPTLDARANIQLPLRLAGRSIDSGWFDYVVESLALTERLSHKPWELSGGQVQRVAVARALLARPALLVADEPTGNLDSASSAEVLDLLRAAVDDFGQTVVMVTHDPHAAARADRVLVVRDGQITHDLPHPDAAKISEAIKKYGVGR